MQRCLFLKSPHFHLLFSENYPHPHVRINRMVYKHFVDYHPIPSQLISRIHYLIFLWNPKGFIFPVPLLIFFQNLYILLWLKKSFKFMVWIKINGKFICGSKKLNLFIFTHAPKPNPNSPPEFYHYPPG